MFGGGFYVCVCVPVCVDGFVRMCVCVCALVGVSMCSWVCGCVCLCVRACWCEVREGDVCMCVCVCMACAYMRFGAPDILTPPHTHTGARPHPEPRRQSYTPPTHPHTTNEIKPPSHPTHTHTPPSQTYAHTPA